MYQISTIVAKRDLRFLYSVSHVTSCIPPSYVDSIVSVYNGNFSIS